MNLVIAKKIEIRGTGVFVISHVVNPNVYVNLEKKTVRGTIQSYTDPKKSALKTSPFAMPLANSANMENEISDYLSKNLDEIINGKRRDK